MERCILKSQLRAKKINNLAFDSAFMKSAFVPIRAKHLLLPTPANAVPHISLCYIATGANKTVHALVFRSRAPFNFC